MRGSDIIGIYCISNKVNYKKYIGASKQVKQRLAEHKSYLRAKRHQNIHLQRAWNKYGEKNFSFEIILICDLEQLDYNEIKSINDNKSNHRNFGYNFESGGRAGKIVHDETRRKMSNSHKGLKQTREHIRNNVLARAGYKPTAETIQKISNAQKGYKPTAETIQKLRESHIGKKLSAESIKKRSETRRKNGCSFKPSNEIKKKISDGVKKYHETIKKIKLSHDRPNNN